MGSKLIFIRHNDQIISGLIDGNDLVEVQAENRSEELFRSTLNNTKEPITAVSMLPLLFLYPEC